MSETVVKEQERKGFSTISTTESMLRTIPVLAVVQSSFVEVEGLQKQEKLAVQGRRQP